jgi:tRNA(Ser,Leu) C12 N-acetylase TAN1
MEAINEPMETAMSPRHTDSGKAAAQNAPHPAPNGKSVASLASTVAASASGADAGPQAQSLAWSAPPWNVLVTVQPAPRTVHQLLDALHVFGEFRMTPFHYVCRGWVKHIPTFLDAVLEAQQAGRHWTRHIARVVPIVCSFEFAPDSLQGKLEAAAAELASSIAGGTCFVRVERRGLPEEVHSADLERAVADRLFSAVEAHGGVLHTSFSDPDYIVAIETLDTECGIALITREIRRRYPFVRVR